MAVLIAARLLGGLTVLFAALHTSLAAAEGTTKGPDFVRVVADQMHQLEVVKVAPYAFPDQRSAIGQIAFNEDASTIVLTPFSGRVIRLIAKVGDQVKRGDPLLEIDSPEQVPPQNEFIAAQTARNKARSQLGLAQIAEKRARDLYEGKAVPFKDLQAAEAQLPPPRAMCGRPIRRSTPSVSACASWAAPTRKFPNSSSAAPSAGSPRSTRRLTAL